jgi:hypothetical protein
MAASHHISSIKVPLLQKGDAGGIPQGTQTSQGPFATGATGPMRSRPVHPEPTPSLARIMHETPAATADMVVLPGVLGCSFDRLRTSSPCDVLSSTPQVRAPGVARHATQAPALRVTRPSPRSPDGVSCIMRARIGPAYSRRIVQSRFNLLEFMATPTTRPGQTERVCAIGDDGLCGYVEHERVYKL